MDIVQNIEKSDSKNLSEIDFTLTDNDILSEKAFRALFPQAVSTIKPNTVASRGAVALVLDKVTLPLEERQKQGLAPPQGVSKKHWVCLFGNTCRAFNSGLIAVDLKIALDICKANNLTTTYSEEEGYPVYFKDVLGPLLSVKGSSGEYQKRVKDKNHFYLTTLDFLSLIAIEKPSHVEKLKAELGSFLSHINVPGYYYACLIHFGILSSNGQGREVQSDSSRYRLPGEQSRIGSLIFKTQALSSGKEHLSKEYFPFMDNFNHWPVQNQSQQLRFAL